MKIEILEMLKRKSVPKELHLVLDAEGFYNDDKYIECSEPIKFDGELNVHSGIISLVGDVNASVKLNCSRCLEPVICPVVFNIEERFCTDEANLDEDIIFLDSDSFNITEIIENNIVLALPFQHLCKETCEGLCQVCGVNLNYSTCSCNVKPIDPRLEKLKDMFSTH